MVNGTRTRYDAILVVGIVARVAKCINGALRVGRSCKEIIGNCTMHEDEGRKDVIDVL
jgi:hypothetical protein